jgi:hypothetical protein
VCLPVHPFLPAVTYNGSIPGDFISLDNIKMDLREVGWDGMDLIDLAEDRDRCRALVNAVMNLRVP